jgi:DNA anti-recombination protein RmuC
MDNASRNKWQVRGFALLIFLLGLTSGIMTVNAYHWVRARRPPADRFEQLATRLQLNADQKTKVKQIFGDTRQQLQNLRKESEPRVNDIRQQTDQKLQQVLSPDQWKQFQQMRDEMRARRGPAGRSSNP